MMVVNMMTIAIKMINANPKVVKATILIQMLVLIPAITTLATASLAVCCVSNLLTPKRRLMTWHRTASVGWKTLFASKPCVAPIFVWLFHQFIEWQINYLIIHCQFLRDILIFKWIADLKMVPLIHIWNQNDCVHDKNVIVPLSDFLFQIFIIMVIADFLSVIIDHWMSCIFHAVIGPIGKNQFYN